MTLSCIFELSIYEQDMKDLATLEEVIVSTPAAAWFSYMYNKDSSLLSKIE